MPAFRAVFLMIMKNNGLCKLFFYIWTVAILVLLLLPPGFFSGSAKRISLIPYSDKVVHFILFGVFCFSLYLYVRSRWKSDRRKLMLLCLSVTAAYGLAGEVLQMLTNQWLQRTFSWTDFLADVAGASVALLVLVLAKVKTEC